MKLFQSSSSTSRTLSIFKHYTSLYKMDFYIGAIGSALAVITQGMIPPYIVAKIFSKLQTAYLHHDKLHLGSFLPLFLYFTLSMLAGLVFWRAQGYFTWNLETKVRSRMSNDTYNHLQSQSQRFHADRFGGALVSQTNKFISAYERLMDDFIWSIIPGLTTIVVAILVLLLTAYPYALVMLVVIAIYLVSMSRRVGRQMPFNIAEAEAESDQTAALADAITNMSTIRAFAGENYETKRFKGVTDRTFRAYSRLSIEAFKTELLSQLQTNAFQVIIIFFGLLAVTDYSFNVGVLYLAISYTQSIVGQLSQFSRIIRNTNRSLGDSAEMTDILAISPEVKDSSKPLKTRMSRGEVKFSNVLFAYPENQHKPLFEALDLKIKPGEKVGLVGPSGGGKTTITKLLLRFMDIQDGQITIDGQNIADVKQADLRSRIAYVSQEPILFHRNLAENIGYGDQTADQRVIEGVAKMAHAHDFISKLPQGYQTLVGERGVKLSGGQRQRVAIARAMLKNAPILVLDEATSALDSESEVLIQDALWRLMEGRTAIVVAHRLSTIQKMDRILVIDNGQVVEQGSHKELIRFDGVYAKLWAHQSGSFMDGDD